MSRAAAMLPSLKARSYWEQAAVPYMTIAPSKASFLLMSHRQNRHSLSIETIANHISAIAEFHRPIAEGLVQVFNQAAYLGMRRQNVYSRADGFHRTFGSGGILFRKKSIQALDMGQRRW